MTPFLRPLLAAAFLSFGAFTSCQKAQVAPTQHANDALLGHWYLAQTSGGIAGTTQPANPQQVQELIFMTNGQVQAIRNGAPTATSTYVLTQAVSATTQRTETFITYGNAQLGGRLLVSELSSNNLSLSEDHPDGLCVKYQRVMPTICLLR